METAKLISQLVNAHKVSSIIVPLSEAVEINKRTHGIKDLSLNELFSHVIETGGDIYETILDESKNGKLIDTGLVPDKLFFVLSKALRNCVILYNSASLSLIKDDIIDLFSNNIDFIQQYQNDTEIELNGKLSEQERKKLEQESFGYVTSSLSQAFMPIWLFHTNLYTSGFIKEDELVRLNRDASDYVVTVIDTIMKRLKSPQGKYSDAFSPSTMFICSEMIANITHSYNCKLIKNQKHLDVYITSPDKVLSSLLPAIYSCFSAMNDVVESAVFGKHNSRS